VKLRISWKILRTGYAKYEDRPAETFVLCMRGILTRVAIAHILSPVPMAEPRKKDLATTGTSYWNHLFEDEIPALLDKISEERLMHIANNTRIPESHIIHDHPEFCSVLQGEARMDTSGDPLYLKRGDFLVIAPHMYHMAVSTTEHCDILWIASAADHVGIGLTRHYQDSDYSLLNGTEFFGTSAGYDITNQILDELIHKQRGWFALCRALILQLGVLTIRHIDLTAEGGQPAFDATLRSNSIAQKARLFISRNFSHSISLADVAHYVALSPNYLANLFKKETGTTVIGYLTELRIDEAKRLLAGSDKTVSQIAFTVGYSSPYYFSRQFKQKMGTSPRDFRENGKP